MTQTVNVYDDGPLRIIRIDRSEVRNAINAETARALRGAWQDFEADDEARVGILTGGAEVFSAGADLSDLEGLLPGVQGDDGPLGFTRMRLSKPTIAAVAGYCVAGGLEMALWCDLRVADETAIFGCFERRFGVPLVDGGTQRLPRIVGLGRALDMILTGRPVEASEAHQMGLVNKVVPEGEALSRAIELAHRIAAHPQICLRSDRAAVYDGIEGGLEAGLRKEAERGNRVLESEEPFEGVQAFRAGAGRGGTDT